jgi:hypothetical protein
VTTEIASTEEEVEGKSFCGKLQGVQAKLRSQAPSGSCRVRLLEASGSFIAGDQVVVGPGQFVPVRR